MSLDQILFSLDAETFAQFESLCNAPTKPNPALDRLLASHYPWENSHGTLPVRKQKSTNTKQRMGQEMEDNDD